VLKRCGREWDTDSWEILQNLRVLDRLHRQECPRHLANAIFVEGHADGGVHADFFQGEDFAARGDAAGSDNRQGRGRAQVAEPVEIYAGHGALAVHIGAEEGAAIGFQLCHDFTWRDAQGLAPAVDHDFAPGGIEGDHDLFFIHAGTQALKKGKVGAAIFKGGAADNDLGDTEFGELRGAANRADAAADADFHAVFAFGADAEFADEN